MFEFNGRRGSIKELAALYGLSPACVQSRLRYGIPLDQPKSRAGRPLGWKRALRPKPMEAS